MESKGTTSKAEKSPAGTIRLAEVVWIILVLQALQCASFFAGMVLVRWLQ